MAELHIDMTIPIGDAGIVRFTTSINDLGQLTAHQRQVIAGTGAEFYAFAAATLAPQQPVTDEEGAEALTRPATARNTDSDVLRGVTGSRHQ